MLAALLALAASPALAANGTWSGGAGATWSTGTTNWLNLTGIPWDITNGGTNTAIFNTAGATPTVSGTVFVNGITFANSGTISGGSISLAGATPIITTSSAATINSILTGTMGFQKIGGGILTLSSSNTYTGATQLTGGGAFRGGVLANGGLASGIGASSSAASNLIIENGGQLNASGTTDRLFTLGAAGQAWIAARNGALAFTNTGTIAVSGSATHNLRLADGGGGLVSIFAPAVVDFSSSLPTKFSVQNMQWSITGTSSTYTGVTQIEGGGTLVASSLADGGVPSSIGASTSAAANLVFGQEAGGGNNTLRYAGTAAASTDRLFTLAGLLGAGAVTTIDNSGGGALSFTNTGTIAVSTANSTTLRFVSGSNAINFAPAIVNGSGTVGLTKDGTNALVLTGSNTYTGVTTLNAGTLQIGSNGTVGSLSASSSITGSAGATLAFNRTNTVTQGTNFASTIGGGINLAQNGAGTLVLSGSNTYSGVTTLSAGQLNVNNANAIGTGTFTISSGSLDNTSAGLVTLATNNPQNWNGDFTFVGSNPLNLGTGAVALGASRQVTVTSSTLTAGGAIAGSGFGLTKAGDGTLVLSAAGTYTGTTSINAGTLQIGNGSTTGALSSSSAITGSAGATLAFSRSNTVTQGADFNSTIGGGVRVAQNGTGTLVLNGSNSYTGGTVISSGIVTAGTTALGTGTATVNGGTLQYAAPIQNVAATVVNNGGTLAVRVGGSGFTSGNLDQLFSGTGGTTLNSGAMVALDTTNGGFTYSSVISGNTGIQKIGTNNLVLSSSNTYLGVTRLSTSALNNVVLANGGQPSSIGSSSSAASNLIIENGAQLNASGTTDRLFTLGAAGQAWLGGSGGSFAFTNPGVIAVSGSAAHNLRLAGGFAGLFAPAIRDFNASNKTQFTVQNTTFQITGTASDYTGVTNIDAGGTLVASSLANGGVASSIGASTSAASNLVFGLDAAGFNNTLRYAGAAAASTDRLFTLGSLLQAGVVTTIDNSGGGALSFTHAGSIAVSTTNSTTLRFVSGSNAINFAPVIVNGSGTVGLTKEGANALTLTGVNTYSGATTVSAGQLQIGAAGAINSTSAITVNGEGAEFKFNAATPLLRPLTLTRGTLSGTGTINTPVSIGANAILSPGNSPGTQTYQTGTFAGGGSYTWEINNWASGTAGVNYDQAIFTNGLAITSSSGSPFTINLTSLKADNTGGAVPGFNSGFTGLSFAIATGSMTGFSPSAFTLGTSSFLAANTVSGSAGGGFWLSTNSGSDQLILNYAPSATYTLSATPSAAAIYAGGSVTITGSIASSTADRTAADAMRFSNLSVGQGTLSVTTGTLLSGSSTAGTVSLTLNSAGLQTFTPTVSATNVNLGTTALAGAVTSGSVAVWNSAGVNTISAPTFANVRVGGTFATQALTITNTAASGSYTEVLGATGSTSGLASLTGSVVGLAGGSSSTAISVGLGGSSNTATAGLTSGSATVSFTSTGGPGTASISSQTIAISGGVYDFAQAKFSGTTLDFGVVHQGASVSSQSVAFGNQTVTNATYQDLLDVSATTGNARVTATGFTSLAATAGGATTNSLVVSVSTGTAGSLISTLSLTLTSNANGVAGLSNGTAGTVGGGSITTTGGVFSGNGIWNVNGGGSWGTGANANWTSTESVSAAPGTFAGYANTDTARFGATLAGGTASIKLNGAQVSLASIAFDNTSGRYLIESGTGAGSLTLAVAAGKPVIDVVGIHEIAAAINGASGLQKTGLGTLVLSGSSTYSGGTDITAGTLAVNGFLGNAVNVANAAILGGSGVLDGPVTVAAGGILAPGNSPGTLTMNSNLVLNAGSTLNFELNATDSTVGSGINDLVNVGGNFTLAGILNVAGIGDFANATNNTTWRLFNYTGTLTGTGLTLGSMPSVGATGKYFQINTATAGQVNLVIVPEPGALALAGVGVGLAGWLIRRRR